MKIKQYITVTLVSLPLFLGLQSCYQDLGQDPAFNYPPNIPEKFGPDQESVFIPFENDYKDLVYGFECAKIDEPTFVDGKIGKAYKGKKDAYLTFEIKHLLLQQNLTVMLWYKLDATASRAGLLSYSPINPEGENLNNLKSGFRLLREGNTATDQALKLNVGKGTGDAWVDGPTLVAGQWTHIAFTFKGDKTTLYIDGELVKQETIAVDWSGTNLLSIGSGAPRFAEWNHLSDDSTIDQLRILEKALTQDEIKVLMTK